MDDSNFDIKNFIEIPDIHSLLNVWLSFFTYFDFEIHSHLKVCKFKSWLLAKNVIILDCKCWIKYSSCYQFYRNDG